MLMLIKPGEDFLDVIAKVLSLTAILTINYYYYDTQISWDPWPYPEVTKIFDFRF